MDAFVVDQGCEQTSGLGSDLGPELRVPGSQPEQGRPRLFSTMIMFFLVLILLELITYMDSVNWSLLRLTSLLVSVCATLLLGLL